MPSFLLWWNSRGRPTLHAPEWSDVGRHQCFRHCTQMQRHLRLHVHLHMR